VSARVTASRWGGKGEPPLALEAPQLGRDVEARGGGALLEDRAEQLGRGGLGREEAREVDRLGRGAAVLVARQRLGAHEAAPVQLVDGVPSGPARPGAAPQRAAPARRAAGRRAGLGPLDERVDQPRSSRRGRLERQAEATAMVSAVRKPMPKTSSASW